MLFMHPTVHETEFRRASCLDSQSHRVMVDPSTDTSADRDSGARGPSNIDRFMQVVLRAFLPQGTLPACRPPRRTHRPDVLKAVSGGFMTPSDETNTNLAPTP